MVIELKPQEQICHNCKWFVHHNGEDNAGYCYRKAPLPHSDDYTLVPSMHPQVLDDDWCGEFEAKSPN